MPSHLPAEVRKKLAPIRLLVLDVDGVLTDGGLYFSAEGEALKRFSVRDGLAVRLLFDAGIEVAVITGRSSGAVAVRCRELGLKDEMVVQGSRDKAADLAAMIENLGFQSAQAAAMGDDLPDLPLLNRVGFAACPGDAAPEVIAACDYVCDAGGGKGAVREVAELILKSQRRWADVVDRWVRSEGDPEGGRL